MNSIKLTCFVLFAALFFTRCSSSESAENKAAKEKESRKELEAEKIVAIARIEPETKIVNLSSEVSGVVKEVRVKTGDFVKKGDILLILSNEIEKAQLSQNQANVQVIQGNRADLEVNLLNAQIKAENLLKRYERLKSALDKNAETQQNVDNAETEYKSAVKEAERLKTQISSNYNQVNESREKVVLAEVQIDKKIIRAPADGTILSIDVNPGTAIIALNSFAEFAPDSPTVAICEVDELFATEVKNGQKAFVRLVGKTEVLANGVVVSVAPYLKKKSLFSDTGGDLEDRRVREVKIRLEKNEKLIFGMRVEGVILLK